MQHHPCFNVRLDRFANQRCCQEMYQDDDTVWDALLTLVVSDLARGAREGIYTPEHGLIHTVVIGNKGDWSYLVVWRQGASA